MIASTTSSCRRLRWKAVISRTSASALMLCHPPSCACCRILNASAWWCTSIRLPDGIAAYTADVPGRSRSTRRRNMLYEAEAYMYAKSIFADSTAVFVVAVAVTNCKIIRVDT